MCYLHLPKICLICGPIWLSWWSFDHLYIEGQQYTYIKQIACTCSRKMLTWTCYAHAFSDFQSFLHGNAYCGASDHVMKEHTFVQTLNSVSSTRWLTSIMFLRLAPSYPHPALLRDWIVKSTSTEPCFKSEFALTLKVSIFVEPSLDLQGAKQHCLKPLVTVLLLLILSSTFQSLLRHKMTLNSNTKNCAIDT